MIHVQTRRQHRMQQVPLAVGLVPLSLLLALAFGGCERDRLSAVTEAPSQVQSLGGSTNTSTTTPSAKPCLQSGDVCQTGDHCCSGVCGVDGHCAGLAGCSVIGEKCDSNEQCCSRACADPGTGIKICHGLDGCRPTDELCTAGGDNSECCSKACFLDQLTGVGRCGPDFTRPCLPEGEICEPARPPCCGPNSTVTSPPFTCQVTSIGVSRCAYPSGPNNCGMPGNPCSMNNDCCTIAPSDRHYCTPGRGFLECAASCAPLNAGCRASRDCCTGMRCVDGLCQNSDVSCNQLGQPCTLPAGCCSGNCAVRDGGLMTCAL